MANVKAGLIGAVATVVVVITELILFPIALNFLSTMNSSIWMSASDRTILAQAPTLFTVIVLFTVLGGMIATVYVAIKG